MRMRRRRAAGGTHLEGRAAKLPQVLSRQAGQIGAHHYTQREGEVGARKHWPSRLMGICFSSRPQRRPLQSARAAHLRPCERRAPGAAGPRRPARPRPPPLATTAAAWWPSPSSAWWADGNTGGGSEPRRNGCLLAPQRLATQLRTAYATNRRFHCDFTRSSVHQSIPLRCSQARTPGQAGAGALSAQACVGQRTMRELARLRPRGGRLLARHCSQRTP